MDAIRFSVIIPLFNKEKEINRAITSVLRQSYNDYEIVVINDGSTDDGPEKVEDLVKINPKIRMISQSNAGVSVARNRGVELAKNMFIAFLDADDEWCPDFLKTVSGLILSFPQAGAYATAYKIIKSDGEMRIPKFRGIPGEFWQGLLPSYFDSALGEPPVWTSAVVVPKKKLEEVGMFPVGISIAEDKEVWERIALNHKIAFSYYHGAVYFQSADNRLCNTEHRKVFSRPFIEYAMNLIEKDKIDQGILSDLQEYLVHCCLVMVRKHLFYNGDKIKARSYLRVASPQSCSFKIQKILLTIVSFLPKGLIVKLYKIRETKRN